MPKFFYYAKLSASEKKTFLNLSSKGFSPARTMMDAHILLAADENSSFKKTEEEIAALFSVHKQAVHIIEKIYAFVELYAAISRYKCVIPPVPPKITGAVETKIIALSCNVPLRGARDGPPIVGRKSSRIRLYRKHLS